MKLDSVMLANECPCGSGRPSGKCCWSRVPILRKRYVPIPRPFAVDVERRFSQLIHTEEARNRRFGRVRPMIHTDWRGYKVVAVGDQVHFGNWKTFPSFLIYYCLRMLGNEWVHSEFLKPPAVRHPIFTWYHTMTAFLQRQPVQSDGLLAYVPNGATRAFMALAYDLYAISHHMSLLQRVVARLKNRDQFQGARHELFATATMIRCGCSIDYEDERDRSKKHPEFVATHGESGERIAIEAKSRHRAGVLGYGRGNEVASGRVRIGRLMNEACRKARDIPLLVFLELNLPNSAAPPFEQPWFQDVRRTFDRIFPQGGSDPFNAVVLTSTPDGHAAIDDQTCRNVTIVVEGRDPRTPFRSGNMLAGIRAAAFKSGNIPMTFDDEVNSAVK